MGSGNFIGAGALLGIFDYICKETPIIHCNQCSAGCSWRLKMKRNTVIVILLKPRLRSQFFDLLYLTASSQQGQVKN